MKILIRIEQGDFSEDELIAIMRNARILENHKVVEACQAAIKKQSEHGPEGTAAS